MSITTNTQLILSFLQPRHHSFSLLPTPTAFSFSLLRHRSFSHSLKFSFKSPTSPIRTFNADEDDDEEDEEEDEDDEEDVAADEYDDVVSGEISDEGETFEVDELTRRDDGFKWQRVEKLCNEVREFGVGIIDLDELASVYDFRIDKFQVRFLFLCNCFVLRI